jgi:hypothetical protein
MRPSPDAWDPYEPAQCRSSGQAVKQVKRVSGDDRPGFPAVLGATPAGQAQQAGVVDLEAAILDIGDAALLRDGPGL